MDPAESAYQEAMTLAPDDPLPHSNLAAVYFELGQYAQCAKFCRESLARVGQDGQQSQSLRATRLIFGSPRPRSSRTSLKSPVPSCQK
jgi:Flp pilus assembly protein TadD